ncbi:MULTISPECIES: hypothetical protein [unclassified Rhodococcus (in: high G+C Gram-positive bacteria)]|uniref:hypothetical protein n=1 Tax=unclassified Rhodococcus (in: high G+C Gram-positive bacteria) TaxID=192944 RepID=UPI0009287A3E|nr:hypothetical protein [Rhodococcus sp. M8]OLL20207.1 hypothetical protein BKE56_009695 [Rhodococcus sp. M8]QPG44056.1 hypothetical protein ISO16_19305 [Rhodococcus sp. M8]
MHVASRPAAAGLVVSGVAFAAYPLLRPYGPESGTAFAVDLASTAWLASHTLGMIGFTALALALRSLVATGTPWRWGGRSLREVETRMWLALALLLPYYGAEAYGLSAVGRYALDGDTDVLTVAESFRYAPFEVATFTVGLLLLMLVGGRLAHGTWAAGGATRVGGLLAGLGLATYLPQFFTPPEVRMAHGIVLGLVLLARSAARPLGLPGASAGMAVPIATRDRIHRRDEQGACDAVGGMRPGAEET